MNTIISTILITVLCFGTKLKIEESNFKEIAPGIASGNVISKYDVQVKSTGNKKITIKEVWLKNRKASWTLSNENEQSLEYIDEKGSFRIMGQISVRPEGVPMKSKTPEVIGSFKEDFLIKYNVDGSDESMCLSIDKIEKVESVKMQ